MTDYEIVMTICGIIGLLIATIGLCIALLDFLDKKKRK